MQFFCELFKTFVKHFKCMGGGGESHATYIKRVLLCDFQITLKHGNIDIDGGGGCYFSLTILKENCLLLQLPINFSHTIDARIEKHTCMVPLNIVIIATHLNFFSNFPF